MTIWAQPTTFPWGLAGLRINHVITPRHWRSLFCALLICLTSACGSLPKNDQQKTSYAMKDTAHTQLGKGIYEWRNKNGVSDEDSGLLLLKDGVNAFVARIAIARLSSETLDIQYYLYHNDLAGGLLTSELWRAAERGVRVRVLLDDMDMAGRDKNLAILNAHKNIEIRIFNPFIRGKARTSQFVTRFGSVTRRSHNKAMIADNQIGIIGGRNIGDEYFSADPNMEFGDLDIAITRPGALDISAEFDLYWNNQLAYPVATLIPKQTTPEELASVEHYVAEFAEEHKDSEYIQRLINSEFIQRIESGTTPYHSGKVEILYDHPNKISSDRDQIEFHLTPKLAPYITGTQSELLVISPYFVPGKQGVEFFSAMKARGIQVKVLTNSLTSNDVPIVHAGYSKYRKRLLKAGVEIFELDKEALGQDFKRHKSRLTREGLKGSKASLHAKYFIMDRKTAFIGSLNLDPRSVVENTEIGAVVDSPELATELAEEFDQYIKKIAFELKLQDNRIVWHRHGNQGNIKTFYKEPHSSWWDRFSINLMKLLPAESQL